MFPKMHEHSLSDCNKYSTLDISYIWIYYSVLSNCVKFLTNARKSAAVTVIAIPRDLYSILRTIEATDVRWQNRNNWKQRHYCWTIFIHLCTHDTAWHCIFREYLHISSSRIDRTIFPTELNDVSVSR